MVMNFHIVTLFPESMESYIKSSIIGRAVEDKKIKIKFYNPRDFSIDKDKRIDRKPYGGGPGMVIQAEPVIKAIAKAVGRKKKIKILLTTPSGQKFTTEYAKDSAKKFKDLVIVCGRYEGIDARIKKIFKMDEVSIGDYVLTGGELPALVILDSISRQIKGVLGNELSLEEERISSSDVYTRPEIFKYKNKIYKVPEILLTGNHAKIDNWRQNNRQNPKRIKS